MMAPVALLVHQPWTLPPPSTAVLAAIVALALASTALAYVIDFRLLASAGAINASLVTLPIPVSAILIGVVFLGERLALHHYAGLALIMVGLSAIDGRLAARLRRFPGHRGPTRP
jgi:drug/metabolite transporter (DMT)-like permease